MKKYIKIFLLFAALMMPWAMRAQSTLTVCDGTDSNEYVPIYGYYADDEQTNQMIFPASMLTAMQGTNIEQMVFYVAHDGGNNNSLGNWIVSMGITSASSLNDLDSTTTLTQVYTGPMIFDDNYDATLMTVTFTTPFLYNGGNLLVEFDHPIAANYNHYYFYGITVTGAAYSYGTSFNFLPKTTFSYATCARPANLTASNVLTTSATISWTGNATGYEYELLSSTGGPVVSNTTTATSVNLTGLTTYTEYLFRVRANCTPADISDWSTYTLTTAMCDDACPITIVMHDSWGDGWGDAHLSIIDSLSADTIANLCLDDGDSAVVFLNLCNGRDYIVYWNTGSWNHEVSYEIYALDGTVIDTASDPADGRHLAFTHVCPSVSPDSARVYLSVNDTTMGTTNPAPGNYSYAVGDLATVTAIPNEGYHFVNWTVAALGQVLTLTDNPLSQEVTSMFAGMTATIIANFSAEEPSDSITVILSVNNPNMGTTRPAPGTYTFAVGDSISFIAIPTDDNYYFANWSVTMDLFPFPITMSENPLGFTFDMMSAGMTYNIIANFTDDTNQIANGVYVNVSVSDSTMGYTEPGIGRHEFLVGDTLKFTAYPYEGYEFVGWYVEIFGDSDTIYDNPLISDEPVNTSIVGWEINVTALFRPTNSISNNEAILGALVFERDGMIVVRGAEYQRVQVYDLMGRCIFSTFSATNEHRIRPVSAGVYLVRIGEQPVRRVVVR